MARRWPHSGCPSPTAEGSLAFPAVRKRAQPLHRALAAQRPVILADFLAVLTQEQVRPRKSRDCAGQLRCNRFLHRLIHRPVILPAAPVAHARQHPQGVPFERQPERHPAEHQDFFGARCADIRKLEEPSWQRGDRFPEARHGRIVRAATVIDKPPPHHPDYEAVTPGERVARRAPASQGRNTRFHHMIAPVTNMAAGASPNIAQIAFVA